jgi:hypothetical protein
MDSLAALFQPIFKHVWLRAETYNLGSGAERKEAYWRCANDFNRLGGCDWTRYS